MPCIQYTVYNYMLLFGLLSILIKVNNMRTTLNIDDDIMDKVMLYTEQRNRSEAVRFALSSFIKDQKKKKILALRGQVDIENDWEKIRELDNSRL